jgi:hypothetical protein
MNEVSGAAVEQVKVRVLPDGRMSRRDAARYLGWSEKTLAMKASEGKGPQVVKVGGLCFYFKADLDAFISGNTVTASSRVARGGRKGTVATTRSVKRLPHE